MRIEQKHVEKFVNRLFGKPLAWALYGAGVMAVSLAVAIFHGGRWLLRRRKGVTWAR